MLHLSLYVGNKNNQAHIMFRGFAGIVHVLLYKMNAFRILGKCGKERHNKTSAITCRIFSLSVHPCML